MRAKWTTIAVPKPLKNLIFISKGDKAAWKLVDELLGESAKVQWSTITVPKEVKAKLKKVRRGRSYWSVLFTIASKLWPSEKELDAILDRVLWYYMKVVASWTVLKTYLEFNVENELIEMQIHRFESVLKQVESRLGIPMTDIIDELTANDFDNRLKGRINMLIKKKFAKFLKTAIFRPHVGKRQWYIPKTAEV